MNKSELLQAASEYWNFDPHAKKLAKEALTTEQALSRGAVLEQRKKIFDKASCPIAGGALALVLGLWLFMHLTLGMSMFLGFVSLIGAFLVLQVLHHFLANEWLAYLLLPLAGTGACEDALACLQNGGSLVAAWRDIALSERDQLQVYDYYVMYALEKIHRAREDDRTFKERMRNACKLVHNLAEIAQARDE